MFSVSFQELCYVQADNVNTYYVSFSSPVIAVLEIRDGGENGGRLRIGIL